MNGGLNNVDSLNWVRLLYEAQAARLVLYGRALGLSHSEAEDVLQDTFLSLIKLSHQPEHPENYCLRTYRNLALNFKRNFWRRIKRELEALNWFENEDSDGNFAELATIALNKIPQDQREVITLKIWHKLTFEQIGELLNLSPNTVAGRYRYGIEKLKRILNHCDEYDYERIESIGREAKILASTLTVTKG
ncbi:MAG: RNA polymerase sigma factor [Verrucomicrobiia bacterium]|jgi:RNA polymerase sigma-70 factor (ECF subfamily)